MAIRCSFPHILVQGCYSIKKPMNKFFMIQKSQLQKTNKATKLQIRSSIDNKVFEDESRGIVCYEDENGEIICEGFDEGPRYYQNDSRKDFNHKEVGIVEILQRNLFQIVEDNILSHADEESIAVMENIDWNGFRR